MSLFLVVILYLKMSILAILIIKEINVRYVYIF